MMEKVIGMTINVWDRSVELLLLVMICGRQGYEEVKDDQGID
jgi:hypothetical protein